MPFKRLEGSLSRTYCVEIGTRTQGELRKSAAAVYQVLVTAIPAKTNQLEDLIPLVDSILTPLEGIRAGDVRRVEG